MLWRALKHVEHGFYIDIGAAWPDEHSVTKALYERGWCGINIEPNPEFNRQLQECRPRDRNLRVAVGDREGVFAMNFLGDTGLSTLDDKIAEKHMQAGWSLERQEVQVTTLVALWQQHVPAGQEVHFLKVDVEGFEEAALRGNDWSRHRPWIVVVEATLPMSQVESHESWEPILLAANYRFAYADGLNRFYVADEHVDLLSAFKYPPNVFDDFLLSRQQDAEAHATQVEARATEADRRAAGAISQAQQAEFRATQAETRATQAETRATQAETRATVAQISVAGAISQAESRATQAEVRATGAEARVSELEAVLEATRKELHDVHQANHHHWHLAEARHQQLQELLGSRSWAVTAPLRSARSALRGLTPNAFKSRAKVFLQHAALYVGRRPRLKRGVRAVLGHFPGIRSRLFQISRPGVSIVQTPQHQPQPQHESTDLTRLTPRARQIHADLKSALAKQHQVPR